MYGILKILCKTLTEFFDYSINSFSVKRSKINIINKILKYKIINEIFKYMSTILTREIKKNRKIL